MLVVAGIGFSVAGFYLSSQPWFCNSCHYMKPYVKNWKTSSHSDVACPKCHFSKHPVELLKEKTHAMATTIRYVVGTYDRRPRAEVDDEACLAGGCHDTRLLKGKSTFKRGIIFDHQDHLEGEPRNIKLRCTTCHSQIVQGDHISVTESVCFTCHFLDHDSMDTVEREPLGGCGLCHGAPSETVTHKGFTFDHARYIDQGATCMKCHVRVTRGTGVVRENRCYDCHMEEDRQKYDRKTIHNTHVTEHKVECFECHEEIQHGLVEMTETLDLTCGQCHVAERDMLAGVGSSLVADSPGAMYLAKLSCQGCHHEALGPHPRSKVNVDEMRKGCVDCHEAGYDAMLAEWAAVSSESARAVEGGITAAEAALSGAELPDGDRAKVKSAIAKARSELELVRSGGAVHNMTYSLAVLEASRNQLAGVAREVGLQPGDSTWSAAAAVPEQILSCVKNCHLGMRHKPTVDFQGKSFPHDRHLGKNAPTCETCHNNKPEHGTLTVTLADCTSCHHKNEPDDCATCHRLQAAVFAGKGDPLPTPSQHPGIMSDDIPCQACHTTTAPDDPAPRAVPAACDECHDKGTGTSITSLWQSTTKKLHTGSRERLNEIAKDPALAKLPLARQSVDAARSLLDAIEQDGSWGVHNHEITDLMIREADGLIGRAARLLKNETSAEK